MNYLYSILFSMLFCGCHCAKILGVFPAPGYSQFILGRKLMLELANRGHDVTIIAPYAIKDGPRNYKTILVDDVFEATEEDLFHSHDISVIKNIIMLYQFGYILTEYTLAHKNVQSLLYSNETFDLIIIEQFFNEAHMGFAHHFNAPFILFSSMGSTEWNTYLMGHINLPSLQAVSWSHYTNQMNFFQRFHNSAIYIFNWFYREFYALPHQQNYVNKYFPKSIDLRTVRYNSSLMLMNSHPVTSEPNSFPPSVIEIGGYYIENKPIPKLFQKFLDEASSGAVLFSMGTNLNISNLSNETIDGILNAFSRLEQKVLWKFEKDDYPVKARNVLISKWLPQSDVLTHPNIVAFVTHGGLLSTTEAIFNGVPIVGIPVFGDQKMNVARAVKNGIGILLPLNELNEENLYNCIKEVTDNPSYKTKIKHLSDLLRNQPITPLENAMFWIEHVLKFKESHHFKISALNLSWFQIFLVDILSIVLITLFIIVLIILNFCKYFMRKKNKKIKNN